MALGNSAPRPNGNANVSSGKFCSTHYANETPTFTLASQGGGALGATSYTVRNYYGDIVTTGAISGTTITLPGPLPLGWYKMYLTRPTSLGEPYFFSGGEHLFAVVRAGGPLLTRPAFGATESPGSSLGEGINHPARGMIGLGPHRLTAYVSDMWYTSTKADLELNAPFARTNWPTDAVRPLKQIVVFPDGAGGATPTATDIARTTAIVTGAVANGVTWFEGLNEPNNNIPIASNYAPTLASFASTVRAASASAQIAGPCPINIHGGVGSNSGREWMRQLFIAGGAANLDVITFHNYNIGDLPSARKSMDAFVAMLTSQGQQNKPRYNTEFGSLFAGVYGSWEHRLQGQNVMLHLHIHEQYGVPKEQTSYFYDHEHGYWTFPSFWLEAGPNNEPTPLVPLVRVWSEELFGKAFAAQLDFGTIENDHWIGSRFDAPGGSKVVIVQSGGREGTVSFGVTGASTLTYSDAWGNVATKAVVGGLATFDVTMLPTYIRLPAGVICVPEIVNYGIEVLQGQGYSAASANTNTSTAYKAIDNVTSSDDTVSESFLYLGVEGTAAPSWWQVDLPRSTRIDTAIVMCPEPWQHHCSLLSYELQTWNGSTWVAAVSVSEPAISIPWTSMSNSGNCWNDSYWSRKNVWVLKFPAVATTKVRIYATAYSYGSGPTLGSYNGNAITGVGETGQGCPPKLDLREVRLFLAENAGTFGHGQPMVITG